MPKKQAQHFDVAICGGGIAGLSLARQLSLERPKLAILVLETLSRPIPEAAFKVGESTIETGAYYLSKILGLQDHLEAAHLEKLGLRYFFRSKDGQNDLGSRPEYGARRFLPAPSYQIDRGIFESHLRELLGQSAVDLREGAVVSDVEFGPSFHTVRWRENGDEQTAQCRWVIDAMGRKRYLQRRLGLQKRSPGTFNSVWFRVQGRVDVDTFVPGRTSWHGRVEHSRWLSTNHFMGDDYWVWVIPLASDNTSIGIVAQEPSHPFSEYSNYERASRWLSRHEPVLANNIRGRQILDFKGIKDYSYSSKQAFSIDRWACIGEAAGFADPYYSVGSNMIAFGNRFVQRLIELDLAGDLQPEYVAHANRYFLTLLDSLTDNIHGAYPFLNNAPIIALKTIFDYYIGWATTDPQFYCETFLDPTRSAAISALLSSVTVTQSRMLRLFQDWAKHGSRLTFGYLDYIDDLPTLKSLHIKALPAGRSDFRGFINNLREAIDRIEELAVVIFELAVADVRPDLAPAVKGAEWINITAIGLDSSRWDVEGLFRPATAPRDLNPLRNEISRLFT